MIFLLTCYCILIWSFVMVSQNPKRSRSSVYFQGVAGPKSSSHPVETLVTNTIPHTGEDHCPNFEEIYRIFDSTYFPQDGEVLEVYQNILKRGIHRVASRPQLFPYNEETHWCLRKFDASMENIIRKQGTSSFPHTRGY
jgi:hypothetical protein